MFVDIRKVDYLVYKLQINFVLFIHYLIIYISNTQSASEDSGCGLFAYRIYEEFHISLYK